MNYYELFGFSESPKVDKSLLAKKYFELQKKFHPDFFTQASADEKEAVLEKSATINKAFSIFQDADKTLQYFLSCKGLITDDEKFRLPDDFLIEMMELNEQLDDGSKDQIKQITDSIYHAVKGIIENYNDKTISPAELESLKVYYYKKKYLHRILDRLES